MRHALLGSVALLLAACAPDLDANTTERCHERAACGPGASCYRGFCVPETMDANVLEPDMDPERSGIDAGQGLVSSDSATASVGDAAAIADADEAGAVDASSSAVPDANLAPRPSAERDAAVAVPAPMPPANSPCTLAACCEEARKAYEKGEKQDGHWSLKKGKCGCGDPDLFQLFLCAAGSLAGSP